MVAAVRAATSNHVRRRSRNARTPTSRTAPAAPQPPVPEATSFAALGVPAPIAAALARSGITTPFPIQSATLPDALAGRDVLGRARTGSGKTIAFAVPPRARCSLRTIDRQPTRPGALVLVPTHELAAQVDQTLESLAEAVGLRSASGSVASGQARRSLHWVGRRHPRRHARTARGPNRPGPVRARPRRDDRAGRGRPHGRPRVPARGSPV